MIRKAFEWATISAVLLVGIIFFMVKIGTLLRTFGNHQV